MPKWWESGEKRSEIKSKKELQGDPAPVIFSTSNESPGATPKAKTKTQKEQIMAETTKVQMEDGSIQEFGGKKKMLKDTRIEDGKISTKLSFANGRVITFNMPEEMILRFAAFGADQKFGDNIAGLVDIDDCVLATEELAERLMKGEWSMKRESSGMGGTSILVRALVEHTGKTVEKIKEFLSGKSQAEKLALRNNTRIKPIIDRLEAEKAAGKAGVDTDAMLDELA